MKRHQDNSKPSAPAAPTCWQREAPCACLRIEPTGNETHLFPYQQLVTASLVQAGQTETLRLVFATHELELGGRNLREMFHALQDFSVKWVRPIPERYQSTMGSESGIVTNIRIKETN